MNPHAMVLLSGGLDSTLAVRLMMEQPVKVTAVRFMTHFGCSEGGGGSCGHDSTDLAAKLGFDLRLCHLGEEYIRMVQRPRYGYGKNMNPCIDCRLHMLSAARDYMEGIGAGFLVTGEVLNQRPMSQGKRQFDLVDKALGLEGQVLRPLSAKLLAPTKPEEAGIVVREKLLDISGRSRKRQEAMARAWGIEQWAQPAGGCLLTDPIYSAKLRDLWDHDPSAGGDAINLLQVGRHLRLDDRTKVVVGRNEEENARIRHDARPGQLLLEVAETVGTLVLLPGGEPADPTRVDVAASLAVRYSKAREPGEHPVKVQVVGAPEKTRLLRASAATEDLLASLRIEPRKHSQSQPTV